MSSEKDGQILLTASNPAAGAEFGRSVAMDGDLVAVGAGMADAGTVGDAGAVYLFRLKDQRYVEKQILIAPDATEGAEFGRAVAIQGNRVFVGARFARAGDLERGGAVYVFRKQGNKWQLEDKIVSPSPGYEDNFGRALAVQDDRMVVTARKENLGCMNEGSAYVYFCQNGMWNHQAKLTAADAAAGAYFGQSVALKGDMIILGARNADPNGAGAVYIFKKMKNGWTQITKVSPSDGRKNDQYGFSLAVSGDVMSIGARRADLTGAADAGAVYVYSLKRDSVKLVIKLTASDASAGDEFGQSITFTGDVMAVGARKDDNKQGSIYLFHRKGGKWTETAKISASDGMANDEFGYSLSASGNHLVTGAHFAKAKAGTAYVLSLKS